LYGKVHSEYVSVANRVSTNEMQAVNLRDGSLHYAKLSTCVYLHAWNCGSECDVTLWRFGGGYHGVLRSSNFSFFDE
jgi:hypothetical protein